MEMRGKKGVAEGKQVERDEAKQTRSPIPFSDNSENYTLTISNTFLFPESLVIPGGVNGAPHRIN